MLPTIVRIFGFHLFSNLVDIQDGQLGMARRPQKADEKHENPVGPESQHLWLAGKSILPNCTLVYQQMMKKLGIYKMLTGWKSGKEKSDDRHFAGSCDNLRDLFCVP